MILLWIIFYVVLLPKVNYLSLTGSSFVPHILIHIFPAFIIGFLLNMDHLTTCIIQKNRVNKKVIVVLLMFLLSLITLLTQFLSYDILSQQTSLTSFSGQAGTLNQLFMYLINGGLYIAIALCCGYLITCLFDKNTVKHLWKVIIFIAVWILFYTGLLPIVKASMARTWIAHFLVYGFVYAFPFFTAGFLFHLENLIVSLKQKNRLNKVMLSIFIIFMLLICFVFWGHKLPDAIEPYYYYFAQLYIVFALCCGYSITCMFD